MTSPEQRRIALADQLRVLLSAAGLSGRQFAAAVGWQASKVSKILNGRQSVTDADILTWCAATDAPAEEAERLRAELRAIRADEARWSRQLAAGHRAAQEDMASLEQRATRIRAFDMALVPGLLQTAEYAHVVLTALAALRDTPRDTDAAVRARMERQRVLYDSTKKITLLTSEFALRYPIAGPAVMAAQLDRFLALDGLPSVTLGIVPFGVELPVPPLHGFCILDDFVLVEVFHAEASTEQPDDVALYHRIADQLWPLAATGADARAIVRTVLADLTA
ncbi:helix-turn-helix domain-containing protein [Amycolatopsis suaedae]|uniref:XRE family transcriptional regulator n=1 Tax=Amycolatopsis suaedae TaxID=2510978 RepID=A0A4Q7J1P3_9PSEU|nr:helix-turn-helix transcriptional regulator [Amycolatopsis suaedae]RZQ59854.1 XRE family transcriptional regulator [Amycolatopsis suaedae]